MSTQVVPPSPVPPASPALPAKLTFADCIALAAKHPQRDNAVRMLRQSRVFRVLSWGPPKAGKTTALVASMQYLPGKCIVQSLDHDISPWPRVESVLLPIPSRMEELPVLHAALLAANAMIATAMVEGACSMAVLDTATTLYNIFARCNLAASTNFGMTVSPQAAMQAYAAQARAVLGCLEMIYGLREAAVKSPLDSPIIIGVTEHAQQVTVSKMVGPKSEDKMNMTFHHWAPRVGGATGDGMYSACDMQIGWSVDCRPDQPFDYNVRITGAHVGNRLDATELALFTKHMARLDPTTHKPERGRLGVALRAIWEQRKITWAKHWGLL